MPRPTGVSAKACNDIDRRQHYRDVLDAAEHENMIGGLFKRGNINYRTLFWIVEQKARMRSIRGNRVANSRILVGTIDHGIIV